jgi:hypothetical protein
VGSRHRGRDPCRSRDELQDSTVVGPPLTPTVTPIPMANVSGAWTGTFQQNRQPHWCTTGEAAALFHQSGSNLSGNLSTTGCGIGSLSFESVVTGNMFEADAEGWIGEFEFVSLWGVLQGPNELHVILRSSQDVSVGQLILHR